MKQRTPLKRTARLHQFVLRRSDMRMVCFLCDVEMNDLSFPNCMHPDAPVWESKGNPQQKSAKPDFVEEGYSESSFR